MSANEIVIQETSGANPMRVVLRNRAMPYRGMATGGEQRIKTTWYQGNPKATQQILGPSTMPTEISGMWKSKFITVATNDSTVDVEVENDVAASLQNGKAGLFDNPASVVVGIFERLRDRGQELRFSWGDVVRYGLLQSFTPTWDRYEDVAFSMTFEWSGAVQRTPRTAGRAITYGQGVQTALVKSDDALVSMPRVVDTPFRDRVQALQSTVRARSMDLLTYAREAAAVVTVPLRLVQGAAGIVAQTRDVVQELTSDLLSIPYEAFTTSDAVLDVVKAENFRRSFGLEVDSLQTKSIQERDDLLALSATLGGSTPVRVQQRASLRSLAAQYYGSADDWTLIATANGLNSSVVEAGTLIFIPVRTLSTGSEAAQ